MTKTYSVSGMTCAGCATTVKKSLATAANVTDVQVDLAHGTATIAMTEQVPFEKLKESLKFFPSYKITEME